MTVQTLDDVRELAQQLRVDSIRCSTAAGSGHPTSSMSAADLMAVLLARHFRYDWQRPDDPANDHLIFSKGHASPLLYSMFKAAGVVSDDELVNGYRRFGSRLEGHPTPVLPWVDVATGSLGQGLPDGVGVALAGRYLDELPYRVWVLCGDSEMAEGSMWEAFDKAAYYRLDNLTAIVDVNRLGQRGPTELGWDLDAYARRLDGFGCRAIPIDGHDLGEIEKALTHAAGADRPTVILARTRKGRGFSEIEDQENWHGKPLPAEMAERAIVELGGERHLTVRGPRPEAGSARTRPSGEVTLLRDVHRRAAARRRRRRHVRPRIHPIRRHLCRVLHPRLRLHPDGGHLRREHPAVRLPCGGRNRRGRPVTDGPRRSRDDAGRARVHGLVPERRDEHGPPGTSDGRAQRHRLPAHDPRRIPGAVRTG